MKYVLAICFLIPGWGVAQNYQRASVLSSHSSVKATCGKSSDMYCEAKPVGAICILDPQPPTYGRSGLCRAYGKTDNQGNVSCRCR